MTESTCKTCQFYLVSPDNPGPAGFCRRYPPQVLFIDSPNMPDPHMKPGVNTYMPAVHEDLWCGEYQFKGSGKIKAKGKK